MFHCKKTTAPFRKIIPCRFVVWVCVVGICIWAYPSSTWIDLEHVKKLPCFFLSRNLISYGYFKTSHRSCFGTNESRSNYGNMSSQILRDSIFKDSTTAEHFRTHAVNFDFRSLESVSGYIKWTTFFPTKKGLKLSEFEVFRQKKTTSSKVPGTVFLSKSVAMLGTSHEPRDGSHKITAAPKAIGYGWIKTHHWNVEYPTDPKGEWENDNRKHGISVQTG